MKPKKPVKRGTHEDNVKAKIVIEVLKNNQSKLNAFNINQNLAGLQLIERELYMHLSLIREQKIMLMIEEKTKPKIAIAPANPNIKRNIQ